MQKMNMRENQTNGKLITFCGLDGCGKTTMIRRLMSELEKEHQVFMTKQPTAFVRQSAIFRTYMDCPNHDAFDYRSLSLLAASDRVQHVNKVIEPACKRVRSFSATVIFIPVLRISGREGFTEDRWIYEIAESVIKPDIAFFFDVPVELAISRVRSRAAEKDRYIDVALQHRLYLEYRDICAANGGVMISTTVTEDQSYELIKKEVRKVIYND